MKRLLSAILALLLLFSVSPFALAGNSAEAVSIAVSGITLPKAGEKVGTVELTKKNVKIMVKKDGAQEPVALEPSITDAHWSETDKPDVKLDTKESFISGRSYRLTVNLEFLDNAPTVKIDTTKITINGTETTSVTTQGEEITFYCDFVATPPDYTPKASLTVSGEKSKEYDGKATTLTVEVESFEGVTYHYTWYRNGKELVGVSTKSLEAKYVGDSGEYYCKVSASLSDDPQSEIKTTKTATLTIKITPHPITIEIQDSEKNLFDEDPEFQYIVQGELYDELEGELTRDEGEEIGKYSILIGTLAFPEEVALNYEVTVKQGTLSVIDVGDLPFTSVTAFADQSRIRGENDTQIRISASKGAIPEGAVLSLTLGEATAKAALEQELGKKLLKCFTVTLLDDEGKALKLNRHASLKIQIPLTAEEVKKFRAKTITAGLYTDHVTRSKTEVLETDSATYICLQIDTLGTVALTEGTLAIVPKTTTTKAVGAQKPSGAWLWAFAAVLGLCAVGAVVYTIVWNRNNKTAPAKAFVPAKKPVEKSTTPPVKKSAPKPIRAEKEPSGPEPKTIVVPKIPKQETPKSEETPRTVSFEDLEE